MTVTLIVLTAGFILYNLWIYILFGIKNSVSESYYELEKTKHGYFFTFFMWFIAGCIISIMMHIGSLDLKSDWMFFMSASGAAFTGAATMYKRKLSKTVHFTGAASLIVFSLLGIGLNFSNWIPSILTLILLLFLTLFARKLNIKNVIYWFEIIVFFIIIVGFYTLL